uniref:Uncharacterized protein n=1 Tax=Pyrodinium bahamense TaxID=73915 RepID=A0A7S0FPP2_9DINO
MDGGRRCECLLSVKNTFLEVAPLSPDSLAGAGTCKRSRSVPSPGSAACRDDAGGRHDGTTRAGSRLASRDGSQSGREKACPSAESSTAAPGAHAQPLAQTQRPQHRDEDHGWSCQTAPQPCDPSAAFPSGDAGPTKRAATAAAPAPALQKPGLFLDPALLLSGALDGGRNMEPPAGWGEAGGGGCWTPPPREAKLRPCKGKRERFKRLLGRIARAIDADPSGFDFARVPMPPPVADELGGADSNARGAVPGPSGLGALCWAQRVSGTLSCGSRAAAAPPLVWGEVGSSCAA